MIGLGAAPRNLHVEQQQIRPISGQHRERLVHIRGLQHLVASEHQQVVDEEPIEPVVLDDQNAGRGDRALGRPIFVGFGHAEPAGRRGATSGLRHEPRQISGASYGARDRSGSGVMRRDAGGRRQPGATVHVGAALHDAGRQLGGVGPQVAGQVGSRVWIHGVKRDRPRADHDLRWDGPGSDPTPRSREAADPAEPILVRDADLDLPARVSASIRALS